MDDGTVARLGDESFYVTTTSTGADNVVEWFTWWNAIWQLDVDIENVTGSLAAVNVAGPRARELIARLTDLDVSNDAFRVPRREAGRRRRRAGPASCGSASSASSATSSTSRARTASTLWDAILERGADLGVRPFGLEAQRILRLEKMHILVGQDTDSESNALERRDALDRQAREGRLRRQVGARARTRSAAPARAPRRLRDARTARCRPRAAQVVVDGRPAGRVTSARWSEEVGRAVGMAWVPPALAEEGAPIEIRVGRAASSRRVVRRRPSTTPRARGSAREPSRRSSTPTRATPALALAARARARAGTGRDPRRDRARGRVGRRALGPAAGVAGIEIEGPRRALAATPADRPRPRRPAGDRRCRARARAGRRVEGEAATASGSRRSTRDYARGGRARRAGRASSEGPLPRQPHVAAPQAS